MVPAEVELSFGVRGAAQPAVVVEIADGRAVAFRGRIDRVDRAPDGTHLLVLDYKSGSRNPYRGLTTDPVKRGRALQLPVYGIAAQQRFGAASVAGYYWFATERWSYEREGFPLGERELATFRHALVVIIEGIERGLFPARPGERRNDGFENCQICPYDRVCPRDRSRAWQRKRRAPELRDFLDLAEPED
ncbi:MAG: hypothetical protein A2148_12175 [Chloroflexi bacterium RBG_16_68_14]|nr:MAG: hypothetical protein A2148_12175 [Chloroflexi bacterium RBG_16_68_14]